MPEKIALRSSEKIAQEINELIEKVFPESVAKEYAFDIKNLKTYLGKPSPSGETIITKKILLNIVAQIYLTMCQDTRMNLSGEDSWENIRPEIEKLFKELRESLEKELPDE